MTKASWTSQYYKVLTACACLQSSFHCVPKKTLLPANAILQCDAQVLPFGIQTSLSIISSIACSGVITDTLT